MTEPRTEAARRIVAVMYAPPYQGMFKPALIRELLAVEAEAAGNERERIRRAIRDHFGIDVPKADGYWLDPDDAEAVNRVAETLETVLDLVDEAVPDTVDNRPDNE